MGTALGELVGKVHAAGIVHGDLTTSNFVIDKSTSTYTIIDFGLASTTNNDEPRAVDLHVLEKVWDIFMAACPSNLLLTALMASCGSIMSNSTTIAFQSLKKDS